MIEIIDNEVEIVNLYKTGSHAPYTPLEKGKFGYLGILLARKSDGKVQCHECGEWYTFLGTHVSTKHKKQYKTVTQYKKFFGFPILFPLCSIRYSEIRSVIGKKIMRNPKMKSAAVCRLKKAINDPKIKSRIIKNTRQGKLTSSHLNTLDICRDQTIRRILVVADYLKKFPSSTDIERHDPAIMGIIFKRYGTWNKFKEKEFPSESITVKDGSAFSTDQMLFSLREFVRINKKLPTVTSFKTIVGSPSYETFVRKFGSWSRALSMAGLQINPLETKTYRKGT